MDNFDFDDNCMVCDGRYILINNEPAFVIAASDATIDELITYARTNYNKVLAKSSNKVQVAIPFKSFDEAIKIYTTDETMN